MADDNRNKPNQPKKPPEDKTESSSSTENKDPQNQPDLSIASRIQNSASGLARNAFYTPGTPQDLARSLPGGSKAGPASSGALFDRSASQPVADQYRQSAAAAPSARERGGAPGETFRSSTRQESDIPSVTEEFQHTYDGTYDSFQDSTEAGIGKGKGKARDTELELTTPTPNYDYDQAPSNFYTAWQRTTHTQPPDGTAVVSLLSDQTFNPDFPPSANEPFEPIETDLSTQTLTPEEVKMLDLFRRHLPLEHQHQHQSPQSQPQLNHSSLIPDIGSFLDTVPTSGSTDATALRDDVLTSLPGSADWMGVEERYHDEVWGYLRPALEAAAREMEENRNTDTGSRGAEDGPAVQRLKMILRHMQG